MPCEFASFESISIGRNIHIFLTHVRIDLTYGTSMKSFYNIYTSAAAASIEAIVSEPSSHSHGN